MFFKKYQLNYYKTAILSSIASGILVLGLCIFSFLKIQPEELYKSVQKIIVVKDTLSLKCMQSIYARISEAHLWKITVNPLTTLLKCFKYITRFYAYEKLATLIFYYLTVDQKYNSNLIQYKKIDICILTNYYNLRIYRIQLIFDYRNLTFQFFIRWIILLGIWACALEFLHSGAFILEQTENTYLDELYTEEFIDSLFQEFLIEINLESVITTSRELDFLGTSLYYINSTISPDIVELFEQIHSKKNLIIFQRHITQYTSTRQSTFSFTSILLQQPERLFQSRLNFILVQQYIRQNFQVLNKTDNSVSVSFYPLGYLNKLTQSSAISSDLNTFFIYAFNNTTPAIIFDIAGCDLFLDITFSENDIQEYLNAVPGEFLELLIQKKVYKEIEEYEIQFLFVSSIIIFYILPEYRLFFRAEPVFQIPVKEYYFILLPPFEIVSNFWEDIAPTVTAVIAHIIPAPMHIQRTFIQGLERALRRIGVFLAQEESSVEKIISAKVLIELILALGPTLQKIKEIAPLNAQNLLQHYQILNLKNIHLVADLAQKPLLIELVFFQLLSEVSKEAIERALLNQRREQIVWQKPVAIVEQEKIKILTEQGVANLFFDWADIVLSNAGFQFQQLDKKIFQKQERHWFSYKYRPITSLIITHPLIPRIIEKIQVQKIIFRKKYVLDWFLKQFEEICILVNCINYQTVDSQQNQLCELLLIISVEIEKLNIILEVPFEIVSNIETFTKEQDLKEFILQKTIILTAEPENQQLNERYSKKRIILVNTQFDNQNDLKRISMGVQEILRGSIPSSGLVEEQLFNRISLLKVIDNLQFPTIGELFLIENLWIELFRSESSFSQATVRTTKISSDVRAQAVTVYRLFHYIGTSLSNELMKTVITFRPKKYTSIDTDNPLIMLGWELPSDFIELQRIRIRRPLRTLAIAYNFRIEDSGIAKLTRAYKQAIEEVKKTFIFGRLPRALGDFWKKELFLERRQSVRDQSRLLLSDIRARGVIDDSLLTAREEGFMEDTRAFSKESAIVLSNITESQIVGFLVGEVPIIDVPVISGLNLEILKKITIEDLKNLALDLRQELQRTAYLYARLIVQELSPEATFILRLLPQQTAFFFRKRLSSARKLVFVQEDFAFDRKELNSLEKWWYINLRQLVSLIVGKIPGSILVSETVRIRGLIYFPYRARHFPRISTIVKGRDDFKEKDIIKVIEEIILYRPYIPENIADEEKIQRPVLELIRKTNFFTNWQSSGALYWGIKKRLFERVLKLYPSQLATLSAAFSYLEGKPVENLKLSPIGKRIYRAVISWTAGEKDSIEQILSNLEKFHAQRQRISVLSLYPDKEKRPLLLAYYLGITEEQVLEIQNNLSHIEISQQQFQDFKEKTIDKDGLDLLLDRIYEREKKIIENNKISYNQKIIEKLKKEAIQKFRVQVRQYQLWGEPIKFASRFDKIIGIKYWDAIERYNKLHVFEKERIEFIKAVRIYDQLTDKRIEYTQLRKIVFSEIETLLSKREALLNILKEQEQTFNLDLNTAKKTVNIFFFHKKKTEEQKEVEQTRQIIQRSAKFWLKVENEKMEFKKRIPDLLKILPGFGFEKEISLFAGDANPKNRKYRKDVYAELIKEIQIFNRLSIPTIPKINPELQLALYLSENTPRLTLQRYLDRRNAEINKKQYTFKASIEEQKEKRKSKKTIVSRIQILKKKPRFGIKTATLNYTKAEKKNNTIIIHQIVAKLTESLTRRVITAFKKYKI